jgi:murein L,D-transpeptidase YcbB/YkuD
MSTAPQKKGLNNLSPKKRIIVIGIFFTALLVVILLFFSLIRGGGNGNQILDLAAYQTELVKLSERGLKDGSGPVKYAAQTAALTMQSQLIATQDIAKKQGVKIDEKQLSRYQSAKTTSSLDDAKKANRFNEEFTSIYEASLTTYQQKLRTAIANEKSRSARESFANFRANAEILKLSYTPPATDTP